MPKPGRLDVRGHGGEQVKNSLFDIGARNGAILFPGGGYTFQMPLLYYTTATLISAGYDVLQVHFDYDSAFLSLPEEEQMRLLGEDVVAAYDAFVANKRYWNLALAGKSLGGFAMGKIIDARGLPQGARLIWLTPMLTDPYVSELVQRLPAGSKSAFFTGTADSRYYDAGLAKRLSGTKDHRVTTIENADHSLELHGDVQGSMDVLKRVMGEIADFAKV